MYNFNNVAKLFVNVCQ